MFTKYLMVAVPKSSSFQAHVEHWNNAVKWHGYLC